MNCREAREDEREEIFLMGFDTWGKCMTQESYLSSCFESPKYQAGKWWVLEDKDKLLSSLIIYQFENQSFGIGSLATCKNLRGHGYARSLLSEVLKNCQGNVFLYSDIAPGFYEKLGFVKLPKKYQQYSRATCMLYGDSSQLSFIPRYF